MLGPVAFPYFGGKSAPRIRKAVLSALPPHSRYIEPFGGGAGILLAKKPVEIEVYNDVNRGAVNFFRVIADEHYFARFLSRVQNLPFSRALFEEYARSWSGIMEPVEQAARWYYVARQSFSGVHGVSWGACTNSTQGGMASPVRRWLRALDRLPEVHERMRRVQIECSDWRVVIERYAGDGWLAYCDPPYVHGARRSGGYEHELSDRDHRELVERLMAYDGAVVLSGYRTPLYKPLDRAGWESIEIDVVCAASGRTRANKLQGPGVAKKKQGRVEVIWRNPEALRRIAELKP